MTPRGRGTYRAWRRLNAIQWKGVEPDAEMEHQLIPITSKRGETHYKVLSKLVEKDTQQVRRKDTKTAQAL